ncbi:MAG: DNA topoisomerase (ATP-hydrolyzing), partial [Planctomycetota bacterium]
MARKKRSAEPAANGAADIKYVSLAEETRRRYLNYALSVISSRALPDVRDGLKPVQRRILYVMREELRLDAGTKPAKCARIVGDVTGKYHPHGGEAAYEALVRLAQDFTLRDPLIDGQGNFGSVLGLPQAAMRYTEARLSAIAGELMSELRFKTVPLRPTYDGENDEPVVFPSRFPNLLVNGVAGIAVGMATNIPPHNLGEVVKSCLHLIDHPDATVAQLMQKGVKGPDFPLGGRIVTDRKEIRRAYEEGRGPVKVRGEWKLEAETGRTKRAKKTDAPGTRLVIDSVPYGVPTNPLVSEIGALVEGNKIPQLLAVDDETDGRHGLRIVLTVKSPADAELVMAYLYKHTKLEENFSLNLTALVPSHDGGEDEMVPARLSLKELLRHFLDFRLAVTRKRLEYQLSVLEKRIHILEGFEIVFDGIDRAIKIIRNSTGKEDACEKLMAAFPLDRDQTMAILELQLYRIATLEIDAVLRELEEKREEAARITKLLKSEKKLWALVRDELGEIADKYGTKRRTTLGSEEEVETFDANAYIVKENTNVVLTRDGWIKRVGNLKSVDSTRVREGDAVVAVCPASTIDAVAFFADDGSCFTLPVRDVPAGRGYGEPLSKFVKMADGVRPVAAVTTDPRFTPSEDDADEPGGPFLFVATERGQVMRLPFSIFREPSTKSGRRYCRLAADDRVMHVEVDEEVESVILGTRQARVIHFRLTDVMLLTAAGKGVRGITLEKNDAVLGASLVRRPSDVL